MLTQRLWPYYTVHAFLLGLRACRPECRQSRFGVAAFRSGFAGTLASSRVLSTPNPPTPPAPIHGGRGAFNAAPVDPAPSRSFHYTAALPRGRAGLTVAHGGCRHRRQAAERPGPGACRCQGSASPPQKNLIWVIAYGLKFFLLRPLTPAPAAVVGRKTGGCEGC